MVRKEEVLVSPVGFFNEAGKGNTADGVWAGVVDVAKCQAVGLREILIQPRQLLRSALGHGHNQSCSCKLHHAPVHTSRIVAKRYWDRASRAAKPTQKTQIEIQPRVRGK